MNTFYIEFYMRSGKSLKAIWQGKEKNTDEVAKNLFTKYESLSNIIGLTDYKTNMNLFIVQKEVEGFLISVNNIFE